MTFRSATLVLAAALAAVAVPPVSAQSIITTRPDDPEGVYVTPEDFGVVGDGLADDSAALQAALDKAVERGNAAIQQALGN